MTPDGGPSSRSVKCGHHATLLAEAVKSELLTRHPHGGHPRTTHLFIAGPNAFAFFLGQHHVALGPIAVYEWDFEGHRNRSYSLGLRFRPRSAIPNLLSA